MTGLTRRLIFFSGRVQGVGFRYTTQRLAKNHPVDGYVRNLPDGRVELLVEATPAVLDQFVAELQSTMSHFIQSSDIHESEKTGEFDGFEIRY
ncbi:MAG: acylphosphatase [Planctomycetaceae bacterium]|nr:acylphosphatase [Planctomycetaceae bacterium]